MSHIKFAGIYPHVAGAKGDTTKYISNKGKDVYQDFCGAPTDLWTRTGTDYNCTAELNDTQLVEDFNKDCLGAEACNITLVDYTTRKDPPPHNISLAHCVQDLSVVYVQYKCEIPEENRVSRQKIAIGVIALFAVIATMFLLMIYYKQQTMNLDFQVWDVENCTVADFCVRLKIEPAQWAKYSEMKKMDKDTPPLDIFIKNQLEERVTKLPHVLQGHHGDKIEIATINIAYKNRELIKLL